MRGRADAAERTGARIQAAAFELFRSRPFQEVTLQAIANAAGVTLQTVLRRFGSKEHLFTTAAQRQTDAVFASRAVGPPADVATIVRTIVASYEDMGDLNWRGVSQEDQFPLIKQLFDVARARHRQWVERYFAGIIGRARGKERERRTLLLFSATDFYTWKLYRRDLGKTREFTIARMIDLVTALAGEFRRER
jgi:AcrR family transcriptional regulator